MIRVDTTDMTLGEEGKKTFQRSCFDCDKFATCYIWRDMQRVLNQNNAERIEPGKLPIQIEKLAVICSQYYPRRSIEQ